MAEFKIKNLMVDVVSGVQVPDLDKLCLWPTAHCVFPRTCYTVITCLFACSKLPTCWFPCSLRPTCPLHTCLFGCSFHPTTCPLHTTILYCTPPSEGCEGTEMVVGCGDSELLVIDLQKLVINPELIKEVQAELDHVLNAVAERGVEINKAMAPQTLAQAEVLEKELKAALEEVQKLKGNLK